MSSNLWNDGIPPEDIIVPPYKGWGIIKINKKWPHFHHFVGRVEHDGSTYTSNFPERKGINCTMCNITMPPEVATYLQKVYKLVK